MADVTKSVEVIFNATDRFSDKTKSMGASLNNLASPIAGATKSILKVEAAAAAAGAAMIGLSINAAGKFSDSFNEIATLIDAPASSLNKFREDLRVYGSTSTQVFGEINTAAYSAVSAGVSYKNVIESLGVAEKLAVAGNAGLGESLTLVTTTMNAYGAVTKDAARFSDVFFTTVKNGVTTIPELSANMAKVSGIASSTGQSIEGVGAAFATMTAKGTGTAEASTQLAAILNSFLKPTQQSAVLFKKLGIEVGSTALQSKGYAGILKDVMEKTGGNKDVLAQLIPNIEALKGVLTLSGDGFLSLDKNMKAMTESTGATSIAFDKMANNFKFSNQKIANSITADLIGFGVPLLKEYGNVASAIVGVFSSLGLSIKDGALTDVTNAVNDWAQSMVGILDNVAANLPSALSQVDFTPFLSALKSVTGSIGGMFSNADISTADGLASAIQIVIDASAGLVTATAGVVEIFLQVAGVVIDGVNTWGKMDAEMQKFFGTLGGLSVAFVAFSPVIKGVTTALTIMFNLIGNSPFGLIVKGLLLAGAGAAVFAKQVHDSKVKTDNLIEISKKLRAQIMFDQLIAEGDKYTVALQKVVDAGLSLDASYIKQKSSADRAAVAQADVSKAVEKTGMSYEQFVKTLSLAEQEQLKSADSSNKVADALSNATKKASDFKDIVIGTTEVVKRDQFGMPIVISSTREGVKVYDTYTKKVFLTAEAQAKMANATRSSSSAHSDNTKKVNEALSATQKISIEYAKITAQTSTKIFEIKAKVDIAKLTQITERVKAAFSSVDNTVNGTGDLILGLFDKLGSNAGNNDSNILSAIGTAQRERTNALELQKQLVASQIRAANSIIAQGNTPVEIVVHGNDMEIELEAFMWKILDRISIRASADRLEYLKGLSTGSVPV